jgi:hypothetical protein
MHMRRPSIYAQPIAAAAIMLMLAIGMPAGDRHSSTAMAQPGAPAALTEKTYLPLILHMTPLGDLLAQTGRGAEFTFLNPPGSMTARLDAGCRRTGVHGLQANYNFTGSGNGGWGIRWNDAPGGLFNATAFDSLVFWVKGSAPNGFQIGLRDTSQREVKLESRDFVAVSATEWHMILVPLSAFADAGGPIDHTKIANVNIGFNATHGAGQICIDDMAFDKVLGDVFAQVGSARPFVFLNSPGTLEQGFVQQPECRRSDSYGLRLAFDFTPGGNGGWGFRWDDAPGGHFDASAFTHLSLWAKGTAPQGFQLGLRDTSEREGKVESRDFVAVSADEWREVRVPLSNFAAAGVSIDRAAIRNLNVGFNASHSAGQICIDDITLQ